MLHVHIPSCDWTKNIPLAGFGAAMATLFRISQTPHRSMSLMGLSAHKKLLCYSGVLGQTSDAKRMHAGEILTTDHPKSISMPLGIVIRRVPGATRWVKHVWKAVGVLPGAGEAQWKELRAEGDVVEYHAATLTLELFRTDTEAYLHGLSAKVPAIYVVMRESAGDQPLDLVLATASPYEAQDYADTGEELVEKVVMPEGLIAWIRDFVELHHQDDVFIKRRRDKTRVDLSEDGIGDARIRQTADVYRAPGAKETMH